MGNYLGKSIHSLLFFVCFLVCASSYIPVSRPIDAICNRFLFSIYMCITLHVSSIKRSSSGVPHRTYRPQFLWLCLSTALSSYKTVPQIDTITETGGCMYGKGLLMMSAWSSKHVAQTDTNTETGGCMYGKGLLMIRAWRSKHVELYTYR
jgi:hypothetical protein